MPSGDPGVYPRRNDGLVTAGIFLKTFALPQTQCGEKLLSLDAMALSG
jgi:hypothetical protein